MSSIVPIEQLPIPDAPGAPGWNDFVDACAVRNACEAESYGTDENDVSALDMLPNWQNPFDPKLLFVAREAGRVIARAVVETTPGPDAFAWLKVEVHPAARRRGIGSALAERAESAAHELGRSHLVVYAFSPQTEGDRLPAPTGFGSVPSDSTEVRMLLRRGYALEQVERASRLVLPLDEATLARDLESARRRSGASYRVHRWEGGTPTRWLADLALLNTRMSTDAPTAGLEEPEDVWSVDRVLAEDALRAESPSSALTVAVEHLPTGRLVGFSILLVPAEREHAVAQDDTLVLREHRGHRLGRLLKLENLAFLASDRPGHPAVTTFNAEENRPMLDVNEALGFVAVGYEGAWRRVDG